MANEIDELMDLDPIGMTPDNIDSIIAHHRKNRANAEAGIKPKKEGAKGKIDLLAMATKKPVVAGPTIKRRV